MQRLTLDPTPFTRSGISVVECKNTLAALFPITQNKERVAQSGGNTYERTSSYG